MSNRIIEAVLRLSARLGNMTAFGRLGENLDKIDGKARRFNRAQGMIAEGGRNMHATLMRYAAPAALTYGARAAFTDFAELERRMTRIGITADAAQSETQKAFRDAQQFASDFAMPLDEVITGLDTLVSAGMSLKEAMAFLPSILRTAQASGSATEDIANTAQKSASALGIAAQDMQAAFDIMVEGGKAGQFELKDMATYVPELANSFASLGYQGEEGLKALVAILQTIREDTGSASAAATQAQNIFGKMYTEETAKKFAKMGVDLRKELAAARKDGEGAVEAFVRLSNQATMGDLTKLPLLFTDQEFRLGMQSLMTSADSWSAFVEAVNSDRVDGSVLRDFNRVLDDSQAKIDRMSNAWGRLKTAAGAAIAPSVGGAMGGMAEAITKGDAINSQLEKEGYSFAGRRGWWFLNGFDLVDQNRKAWKGGYRTDEERRLIDVYGEHGRSRAAAPTMPVGEMPLPSSRPDPDAPVASIPIVPRLVKATPRPDEAVTWAEKEIPSLAEQRERMFGRPMTPAATVADNGPRCRPVIDLFGADDEAPEAPSLRRPAVGSGRPVIDLSNFGREVETALADGGGKAGQNIEDAAKAIAEAHEHGGSAFGRMFESILNAIAPTIGAKIAEGINANVRPMPVQQARQSLPPATGVKGRTGEAAGTTAYGGR